MNQKPSLTYRELLAAGEPFRLLFPLGVLFGLIGVSLWPAFAWNLFSPYPALIHARLLIECFMGAFVIGFLGTALPRLLDVPRVRGWEASAYAAGLTVVSLLHVAELHLAGDIVFLFTFGGFVTGLIFRARFRKDIPPPGFVLVILGMISALFGVACLILSETGYIGGDPYLYHSGRLLLYQGFLLFPTMGVGAFLLPRFFQLPSRQSFPESLSPPPGWWPRAAFAFGCGLLVLFSFALEVSGYSAVGNALRAVAVLLYFWREVPAHKANFNIGSLAMALRIALFAIPLGYLAVALFPNRPVTFLHIVFITGFGLLTLTVASRVIFGHGGQPHRFKAMLPSIVALTALVSLALAARIAADFFPTYIFVLYGLSGLLWVAGVAGWCASILPGIRRPGDE
ncbi:MAG: NnrS family protein [Opitutales bacterium]